MLEILLSAAHLRISRRFLPNSLPRSGLSALSFLRYSYTSLTLSLAFLPCSGVSFLALTAASILASTSLRRLSRSLVLRSTRRSVTALLVVVAFLCLAAWGLVKRPMPKPTSRIPTTPAATRTAFFLLTFFNLLIFDPQFRYSGHQPLSLRCRRDLRSIH